jgi:GNAT superfamily N-acetyltransferase
MTPLHALGIGELEAIARIWAAALRDGPAGADRLDVAALRQRLATDLHDCHAEVLRVDGEIVAFVLCDLDRRWLRQLFVDPPHQGSGLGTRLLDLARRAMPGGWLRTDAANARASLLRGPRTARAAHWAASAAWRAGRRIRLALLAPSCDRLRAIDAVQFEGRQIDGIRPRAPVRSAPGSTSRTVSQPQWPGALVRRHAGRSPVQLPSIHAGRR